VTNCQRSTTNSCLIDVIALEKQLHSSDVCFVWWRLEYIATSHGKFLFSRSARSESVSYIASHLCGTILLVSARGFHHGLLLEKEHGRPWPHQ
jgi:hypothetical protein